jgi:transcriptional regulator with PAS, ATPase and Fis domain
MAIPKSTADRLAKLLDAAHDPLYVLDDERKVVFCNRALTDWIGIDPRNLVGRQVDYHSAGSGSAPPGVALGLCPPPQAFAGFVTTGHVSCMSKDGRLLHRKAQFLPLGRASGGAGHPDAQGVVVMVAELDLEGEELDAASQGREPTSDELHTAIWRFRHGQGKRYSLDRLAGHSPAAQRAREQAQLAAESRVSVLVAGPPGSGRSAVAQTIHYLGDRSRSAGLLPVDCARLPAVEIRQSAESFAAHSSKDQPGTLLLLDVDQAPGETQTALADFVASRRRFIRLISTARCALNERAAAGEFRDDLACWLSTVTIQLPPLAARLEDLPLISQMLIEDENRSGGKQVAGVSPEALDLLAAHTWPGNFDELAQVLKQAHQATEGPSVRAADIPVAIRHAAARLLHPRREDEVIVLDEFLRGIELELFTRALTRAKGNKTKAAKLLGMTRPRLYRRLVQLGLDSVW